MIFMKICPLILEKILGVQYYAQFMYEEAALKIWNTLSTVKNPVNGRGRI